MLLTLLFIGLAPLLIIIPLFVLFINLLIFGSQNRNISSEANLNIRNGFLLGVFLGPIGMLIRLIQSNLINLNYLFYSILRFSIVFLINYIIVYFVNLNFIPPVISPLFIYTIGITFILRGKKSFQIRS